MRQRRRSRRRDERSGARRFRLDEPYAARRFRERLASGRRGSRPAPARRDHRRRLAAAYAAGMGRGELAGTRVLVRCYHGLGDTIQFARYLPLLAERAARVCVEAQPELISLLRGLPGIADLVPLGEKEHPPARFGCDAEIDITELPHAFRTELGTIPAAIPYLSADPAAVGGGGAASFRGVRGGCASGWSGPPGPGNRSARFRSNGCAARRDSRCRARQSAARPGISKLARGARRAADDRGVRQRRDRRHRRDDRQSRSGRSRSTRWSRISPARSAPRYG